MPSKPRSLGPVLVVGGCGYLGHRIVRQLLEANSTSALSVLDIHTDRNRLPNVSYFDVNICSTEDVKSIFRRLRPEVVFHTASPTAFGHDLPFFEKVNVGGTRNLLEAAKDINTVKAFVYTSSASVIHDSFTDLYEGDDTTPVVYAPMQQSSYSHTKAMAEDLVVRANRVNGIMLTTSLRPSGIFGEGDPTSAKPFVEAAASGKYRYQVGDGKNLFDWTYVGNVVQAHILAADALLATHRKQPSDVPAERRVDGETFLVTNDDPMAFWEFARSIGAAAGYPTKAEDIRVIPRSVGLVFALIAEWLVWIIWFGQRKSTMNITGIRYSMMNRTFRIEKAKERLQYKPEVSMAEAIKRAGGSFAKKA